MRQAIEEGFILDVLKNYTNYKVAYNLAMKILDFFNEPDEVLEAFQPYYQTAELLDVTDPDLIYCRVEKDYSREIVIIACNCLCFMVKHAI